MASKDSLQTRRELKVGKRKYVYYSLRAAEEAGLNGVSTLPVSMKVLLENLLRNEDGVSVREDDLKAVAAWLENRGKTEPSPVESREAPPTSSFPGFSEPP